MHLGSRFYKLEALECSWATLRCTLWIVAKLLCSCLYFVWCNCWVTCYGWNVQWLSHWIMMEPIQFISSKGLFSPYFLICICSGDTYHIKLKYKYKYMSPFSSVLLLCILFFINLSYIGSLISYWPKHVIYITMKSPPTGSCSCGIEVASLEGFKAKVQGESWWSNYIAIIPISAQHTLFSSLKIREGWNFYWVILNSWIHAHLPYTSRKVVCAPKRL